MSFIYCHAIFYILLLYYVNKTNNRRGVLLKYSEKVCKIFLKLAKLQKAGAAFFFLDDTSPCS